MIKKIYDDLPKIIGLISAVSLSLSVLYNVIFFSYFDIRIITLMSFNDHVSSTISFLTILLFMTLFNTLIFVFPLGKIRKRKLKQPFNLFKEPFFWGMMLGISPIFLINIFYPTEVPLFEFKFKNIPFFIGMGLSILNMFVIVFCYKYDLFSMTRERMLFLAAFSNFFILTMVGGFISAQKILSTTELKETITVNNETRNVGIVRIFQNGIVFIESGKLIYRTENEEILLKTLKQN